MNLAENDTIRYKRELVKSIKKFWFGYKVCDGCESIVLEDIAVCPICLTYRFDHTKNGINNAANKILTDDYSIFPIN